MKSTIADAWATCHQVTIYLIENLAEEVWGERLPGYERKTIRMVGAHLHNCRRMWIKGVGRRFGVSPGEPVDRHRVTRSELTEALSLSGEAIRVLIERSIEQGGKMSGFSPPGVHHFAAYMIAHEGHHRGQITMAARQLGYPIELRVMGGMWQWGRRSSS